MLPNSQNIIVGHLNFAIFAETYIFFMYFSKLYVVQQYSFQFAEQHLYVMVVCVSVCECRCETEGSVFMCWSEQFWHLVDRPQQVALLFSYYFFQLGTHWGAEGTATKNDNFVVYFYFQITTVCNYVANILTCTVRLLRALTAHF